jgi:four helix bundle protein
MKTHKDLDVWKKAMDLAENIYNITSQFPVEEKYGLVSQIRRAAVSIPSNIAEGAGRNSNKEFIQFLYISMGSLSEVETQLLILQRLNLLSDNVSFEGIDSFRKMTVGLINYLKGKNA